MLQTYLSTFYNFIEAKLKTKWWLILTTIIATALSLFFQFPNRTCLQQDFAGENPGFNHYRTCGIIAEHPFTQGVFEPGSHEEKMAFRLTMPLLVNLLHLNIKGMYFFMVFISILIFPLIAKVIWDITGDKFLAFFFTLGISNIYLGCAGFMDFLGFFDTLAYLLILIALAYRQPVIIFVALFIANWTDERAILAGTLVLLYHVARNNGGLITAKQLLKVSPQSIAIVASWVVYFAGRYCLIHFFGFQNKFGEIGFKVLFAQGLRTNLALWSVFEGYWMIVLIFGALLLLSRNYFQFISVFGCTVAILFGGLLVFDRTRSLSYAFPVLFLAFMFFYDRLSKLELRHVVFISSIACIIVPTAYIIARPFYASPLYQEFLLFLSLRV